MCLRQFGLPLMDERLKECIESARGVSAFFKKRAAYEEEYAQNLKKLARNTMNEYSGQDIRAGSFGKSWKAMVQNQDAVGENHLRFSSKLTTLSEDIALLVRDAEHARRQHRDLGFRYEKNLLDAENNVEKARTRFDVASEDLERVLLVKTGDSARAADMSIGVAAGKRTLGMPFSKSSMFKSKNPQQILRHEDEFRLKKTNAHESLRGEAHNAQSIRHEYFHMQLPGVLRSFKEAIDELDSGLQFQLVRYAFLNESIALGDGLSINPLGDKSAQPGLREAAAAINNGADFKDFMQNYELARKGKDIKGPHRHNPYDETTLANIMYQSTLTSGIEEKNKPVFGVDLDTQLSRDGVEVPPILEICTDAIERVGIDNMGIYRLSGTTSRVQKLKAKFDSDWSTVDVMSDEAIQDINIVAGCLKQWFRELPEPLLTYRLYPAFIEAAKIENEYLRQVRLHEQVNELPDANYATLRFLMAHLDRVRAHESVNQMTAHNLAIVFGPTLLRSPNEGQVARAGQGGAGPVYLQEMSFQVMAIETILVKYRDIFVENDDE